MKQATALCETIVDVTLSRGSVLIDGVFMTGRVLFSHALSSCHNGGDVLCVQTANPGLIISRASVAVVPSVEASKGREGG